MSDPQPPQTNRRQTLAAAIVIVLLFGGGWWLLNEIQRHRALEDCLASGRRDCMPVETGR